MISHISPSKWGPFIEVTKFHLYHPTSFWEGATSNIQYPIAFKRKLSQTSEKTIETIKTTVQSAFR